MTSGRLVAFIAGCALAFGCSGSAGNLSELRDAPAAVLQARDLLRSGGGGRLPGQLSDLDKWRRASPLGYNAVKAGDIVVLWNAPLLGEGAIERGENQDVVAYEKNLPQDGGWVILSAGTIKKMTASEFAAAPKGGKPPR